MPRYNVTERQSVVLALVTEGLPDKVIAIRMGIAVPTVKVHMKALLRYYDCGNRTQLALRVADAQAWRPVDADTPKDERLLCIEAGEPNEVVDVHWYNGGPGDQSWRGSVGQLRRPVLWRRYPALPDPYLNPGLAAALPVTG